MASSIPSSRLYNTSEKMPRTCYQEKRTSLWKRKTLFRRNHAGKISDFGWSVLPHLTDLVLSDFHLFPSLENVLKDKEFSQYQVKVFVKNLLSSKPTEVHLNGINELPDKWQEENHLMPYICLVWFLCFIALSTLVGYLMVKSSYKQQSSGRQRMKMKSKKSKNTVKNRWNCVQISITYIEHSPNYIALGSPQTHKVN